MWHIPAQRMHFTFSSYSSAKLLTEPWIPDHGMAVSGMTIVLTPDLPFLAYFAYFEFNCFYRFHSNRSSP